LRVESRWVVEFYDFTERLPAAVAVGVSWLPDLYERAAAKGARQGTPLVIRASGEVDPRVVLFFRVGTMASARPSTWRRYAYSLVVWLNFLDAVGVGWPAATGVDVEAFKDWRLTDSTNAARVRPASFEADRAALNSFYSWASVRFGVTNPVPTGRRPARPASSARPWMGPRDPLRPAGAARRQVKWMMRSAFVQWRDVGLRGYDLGGSRRLNSRGGGHEDRDAAFVDGLYGTGLRLAEWASVLDVELPAWGEERFPRAWLAAACAKGGRFGRAYRIPRSVVAAVQGYLDPVEGSRIEAIERARRAGRYERLVARRTVVGYNRRSRVLQLADPTASVPLDVLGPDERRRLFRDTPQGLEPLALWLGHDGLPKRAHGWQDTFAGANARVDQAWVAAGGRPGEVSLWCTPHMCRHSFALKWFSILSLVWDGKVTGFSSEELKDLRDQFGDIWYQLARLLGHVSPATTRDYYLEPFTGLQVDYLMALLDDEERAAVDVLVKAVAADNPRMLRPVRPPGATS
jgi:hypothetical protein